MPDIRRRRRVICQTRLPFTVRVRQFAAVMFANDSAVIVRITPVEASHHEATHVDAIS